MKSTLVLHAATSLSLSLASSTSTSSTWTCTSSPLSPGSGITRGPGPGTGHASLLSISSVFTTLYGPLPLTLGPEQARVAMCDGLLFGIWNGHPHSVGEKPGLRDIVVSQDPGMERTECLGYVGGDDNDDDDDLRLSYMFDLGEDSWATGGLTEVRRCEG
ncbi:hypothetical protein CORC01_03524 [Colletotrichum orchidophilum]|uniref:Uncharacterized protein n=1 Tax=Colletotrichum orchidophilum TaxID=1209926 RepID=A0A1G4BIE1_9PEZI|nr:uncharacterized protein CORC01_03524 [Colletotrichum orchidophilum]OHF01209.1 hypothetical protein CORC01_03524 [Colletotrichum orchidophilum]